jgi:hypothetical protein
VRLGPIEAEQTGGNREIVNVYLQREDTHDADGTQQIQAQEPGLVDAVVCQYRDDVATIDDQSDHDQN